MVFVFYHRLAFDAFKSAGYLHRRLRRGELRQAAVISVKQTLATHLKLLRGLLRVSSDLICDCFEDYFEYREIPSTIAVSRILLESSPNLAAKYSRSIRLCASFTFSRSQITPRV